MTIFSFYCRNLKLTFAESSNMVLILLQLMGRPSNKCAQLGEITTGRPLTEFSINFPPPVTILQPCSVKQPTQILTSKCGAK